MRRILPLVLLLWFCAAVQAAILHVPQEYPAIQAAFDASQDGDTVHVAPGTYHEHLVTPIYSLTVLSDYAWSGDSLDIERTVVDGSWSGTVLQVNAWLQGHFRLEGFTLQRGMGTTNAAAGGVHLRPWANATLRHLVLKDHRSPSGVPSLAVALSGCYIGGFRGRLTLEDLRLEPDSLAAGEDQPCQVWVSGWKFIEARKIRIKSTPLYRGPLGFAADSVILADLVLDRRELASSLVGGFFSAHANLWLDADSITACHATFRETAIMLTGELVGSVRVRRLRVEDVHMRFPEDSRTAGYVSDGPVEISGGKVDVDGWIQRNITSNVGWTIGSVYGLEGVLRHVVGEDLVSGTPVSPAADCEGGCGGGGLRVRGLSLDDVVLRRLTMTPYYSVQSWFPLTTPSALEVRVTEQSQVDTLFFRNVEVSHTVANDPDDYSLPETDCTASLGRAFNLLVYAHDVPLTVIMDSCRFVENRLPNTQPERMPLDPLPGGTRMVGATVYMDADALSDVKLEILNTVLLRNDDGGLDCTRFRELTAENVVLVDNSRLGVYLSAIDSVRVKNLYITGTDSYLAQLTYPYDYDYPSWQCVAMIHGHNGTRVENVTFYDNHDEFVFWCPREDFQDRIYYKNSIISDNTYDFITNPEYNTSLFPPPLFDYCFLPDAQPGVGHLYGQDAGFASAQGPPFLADQSPCIDAGDPNPAYNDLEDPALPGFPLWPAQGSLRNDMGFTGGPHAVALDTSWVSVPQWEPATPKDFRLGAAYPNPFNPMTRIPFTLTRPELVKLSVHNLLGQEVAVLVNGLKMAGRHEVVWNAAGRASGRYLVTLEVDGRRESRAVTLLR